MERPPARRPVAHIATYIIEVLGILATGEGVLESAEHSLSGI